MQQFHQRLPQILQSLEMQLQKEEETKSKRAKKIDKKPNPEKYVSHQIVSF